jgi:Flp pilus assembly protein TadG
MKTTMRTQRDARGATMVVFVLCLVALMAAVTLAVDTGMALTNHRQTQNAADSAALAGAALIRQEINNGEESTVTPANVATEIENKVGVNQNATNKTPSCYFIHQDYTNSANATYYQKVLDSSGNPQALSPTYNFCANPGSFSAIPSDADGVLVVAADQSTTVFAAASGGPKFLNLTGVAAAEVEAINSGNGTGAIMVCAVGNSDPNANGNGMTTPLLIHQTPGNASSPYVLDATQAWPTNTTPFDVRDPSAPDCGLGSSFKGWINGAKNARGGGACGPTGYTNCNTYQFGPTSQWPPETGDLGKSTDTMIQQTATNGPSCSLAQPSGSPPNISSLCQVQIPLCYAYSGGGALSCIGYATFALYANPASIYWGFLLSTSLTIPSASQGGLPTTGAASTVALVR